MFLKPIRIGTKEFLPLVEGGKGVAISNGVSAGAWAACGGIGTFSGANADYYDENGNYVTYVYKSKTRVEKHAELISQSIRGCVAQALRAKSFGGDIFVNMNVLWEMGGCEIILEETLKQTYKSKLIDGVTCGAGMPYDLAKICSKYEVYYFPIVSSVRAFNVLWLRSYKKFSNFLGAVVYEDPWIAGGHNGLSSAEDPNIREDPYKRVAAIRTYMNECGLQHVPIIIAGGVWAISEWEKYLDNPEIGSVAFQFGTRPLLTVESPISDAWKDRLRTLKEGDVLLNDFSPTGFYSSAVYNNFLRKLDERSRRQVAYSECADEVFDTELVYGPRNRVLFIQKKDAQNVAAWKSFGFTEVLKTPDGTIVFEVLEGAAEIHTDQVNCMGCLSECRFSNWSQHGEFTTGRLPDPRSFCIQKTLQDISHGGSIEDNLMFAGANVFRFAQDPFYANGFVPTVRELVQRLSQGL